MRSSIRGLLIAALLAPGCFVSETPYQGTVVAADGTGELIEVSPGVEVVADVDAPIFFADDLYWWMNGGIWYQSTWYGGGWVRAPRVPPHIGGIAHPEGYRRYRPEGWAPHRGPGPRPQGGPIHSRPAPHGGGHRR